MKFQKVLSFEKHFKDSYPDHLSPVYLFICPKEGEKKKILSAVAALLERETDFLRSSTLKAAIEHLRTSSLFANKVGALFDGVDLLVAGELQSLIEFVQNPPRDSYLILGASSGKNISDLYKAGKKEIVILDLSAEKPWEENERLQTWLVQMIHSQKKKITPDAVAAIFKQLPLDRLLLQQEVDKLLTYVGERQQVTREDVEAICSTSLEEKPFQIAQAIAFGEWEQIRDLSDVATILPLVALLRSQLEMGLKMSTLLKRGASFQEMEAAFPRLWPKALQVVLEGAKRKGQPFYMDALQALFELELGLKSSTLKPAALFTRFLASVWLPNLR